MLNNAIDHSGAAEVRVRMWAARFEIRFEVFDAGRGALFHLQERLELEDVDDALGELTKGETTTNPERHTGEGIFFTSKAVDVFTLESAGLRWTVDNLRNDEAVGGSDVTDGTRVRCALDPHTTRPLAGVFEAFTEDHAFTRTKTAVRLFGFGVRFVSRSEAKRLMRGLERFTHVDMDFAGVGANDVENPASRSVDVGPVPPWIQRRRAWPVRLGRRGTHGAVAQGDDLSGPPEMAKTETCKGFVPYLLGTVGRLWGRRGVHRCFRDGGGLAQLVDGRLGMGFGVTSATVLLWLGVAPAAATAATHAAKLPTTLVSGLAHWWRQGNVDTKILVRVALPGAAAAFVGAVILTGISLSAAKAWMSGLLLFFGLVIFARFGLGKRLIPMPRNGHRARWMVPIGALGGFVDATGGGGWGPVVTPSLMTVTSHEPRKVVGTVTAAEFLVAVAASMGFIAGVAQEDIPWSAVLGLVVGSVIVAPFAARLAGRLPHAPMGALVGALIILVNLLTIVPALGGVPSWLGWAGFVALVVISAVVARAAWHRERAERAIAQQSELAAKASQ